MIKDNAKMASSSSSTTQPTSNAMAENDDTSDVWKYFKKKK